MLYIIFAIIVAKLLSWITTKKMIPIYTNSNSTIKARIPFRSLVGIVLDFTCKVALSFDNTVSQAHILFNTFEFPELFIFSKEKKSLFVIYDCDVENLVFVIHPRRDMPDDTGLSGALRRVVKSFSETLTVRNATMQELQELLTIIKGLSDEDYHTLSVPRVDFGFWKSYSSKKEILSGLERETKIRTEEHQKSSTIKAIEDNLETHREHVIEQFEQSKQAILNREKARISAIWGIRYCPTFVQEIIRKVGCMLRWSKLLKETEISLKQFSQEHPFEFSLSEEEAKEFFQYYSLEKDQEDVAGKKDDSEQREG